MSRTDRVFLCEESLQAPVMGACPVHKGDACIVAFLHFRSVFPYGTESDWEVVHRV